MFRLHLLQSISRHYITFYTFFPKQNGTGEFYLPVPFRYFRASKNTFTIFNKVLKMYYTLNGTI
ncbi:hypothetical protein DIU36_13390 [Mucilaginibacter rubeus]|nr:hypothetical protein DIU36_13390 [Mucilaginibacter rubeus]